MFDAPKSLAILCALIATAASLLCVGVALSRPSEAAGAGSLAADAIIRIVGFAIGWLGVAALINALVLACRIFA
jgi:hypothetical protein